jgi:hypothetical protein
MCHAALVVELQRDIGRMPRPGLMHNVSHCMSLSAYLIDAIVISGFARKKHVVRVVSCDNELVGIGGRLSALAPSIWETP